MPIIQIPSLSVHYEENPLKGKYLLKPTTFLPVFLYRHCLNICHLKTLNFYCLKEEEEEQEEAAADWRESEKSKKHRRSTTSSRSEKSDQVNTIQWGSEYQTSPFEYRTNGCHLVF